MAAAHAQSHPNSCSNTDPPMFMNFFTELRQAKVPVTLKEYLMLVEALDKDVIDHSVEDFYYLSRSALVKDDRGDGRLRKTDGDAGPAHEGAAGGRRGRRRRRGRQEGRPRQERHLSVR